jgi:L-lactate dehydrogenase complex protein LldF
MRSMKEFKHLSYASSLCGRCTEVCPVKIDIHKLLLYNRGDSVAMGLAPQSERWTFFFWKKAMLNRETMNMGGAKVKNFILKNFFQKAWGPRRELPQIAPRSFNQMWRDEHPD